MSVSITEILEDAGYDIRNNKEDAEWLLSQIDDFGDLVDEADDCIERYEEYENGDYDE